MLIDNISIGDADYHSILAGIGYPALDETAIYSIISKDQIKELVIEPSLEEYYKFFPERNDFQFTVAGSSAINQFTPTISGIVLGVLAVKFIPQSSAIPGQSLMDTGSFYQNPFYSASQVLSVGGGGLGIGPSFGTPYGYGQETITYLKRFYVKSVESSNKVYWYKWDKNTNTLNYKSNVSGIFYFTLASTHNDISTIQFDKKRSFLDYCKGRLKVQVAETLSLIELDLPASLNADALQEQGEKLIEDNLTYWRESSSFFGMR